MAFDLLSVPKNKYGKQYKEHLLAQYNLAVEMADRISQRRYNTNNYFLAINSFLASLSGVYELVGETKIPVAVIVPFIGVVVCLIWFVILNSFKSLNEKKFKVIQELEKHLPAYLYTYEWNLLKKDSRHKPFSTIETWIPFTFMLLYLYLFYLYLW